MFATTSNDGCSRPLSESVLSGDHDRSESSKILFGRLWFAECTVRTFYAVCLLIEDSSLTFFIVPSLARKIAVQAMPEEIWFSLLYGTCTSGGP